MALRSLLDVPAPAKLNLFLHVVGRRPDGYHRLQSLFVLIDWADTLHFERRADGRLARHDLAAPLPADDLCLRAARLLQVESGSAFGADISIVKRVPAEAGMGGGSSDAATTLLALNRLWQLDWPSARLRALGLRLGADVPFFVAGRNAFVEGIGERLTPVRLAPRRYAVVKPAHGVATGAIFASPLLEWSSEAAIIESFARVVAEGARSVGSSSIESGPRVDIERVRAARNDLEAAARAECAEIGIAAALLDRDYGNSRMTGSGSAVFADLGRVDAGLANGGVEADVGESVNANLNADAGHLPALPSGWQGRICRSLVVHALVGWAAE